MADLPSNAPQMFQLPTATSIPWHGNDAQTVQSAVDAASQLYQSRGNQNLQQQQITNQQQQAQQQIALAQQKQRQEQGTAIAQNALDAYNTYGDTVGPESLDAFQKGMNMVAPGSVDPNIKWDSSMGGVLKTAGDAFDAAQKGDRPWPEAIGVIAKAYGQAGKVQQAKLAPLLQSAQGIFDQGQTTARQQSSQSQDTQRAYAEHAQPLIQTGAILSSINHDLSQNDATSDAIAKANIEKLVANGAISPDDVKNLTQSGGPLEKLKESWNTITTGKTFDDVHRKAMQAWIPSKINELNSTLQSTASTFPGAKPAVVPTRITKTLSNGKSAYSDDGGNSWFYQ